MDNNLPPFRIQVMENYLSCIYVKDFSTSTTVYMYIFFGVHVPACHSLQIHLYFIIIIDVCSRNEKKKTLYMKKEISVYTKRAQFFYFAFSSLLFSHCATAYLCYPFIKKESVRQTLECFYMAFDVEPVSICRLHPCAVCLKTYHLKRRPRYTLEGN